jgi:ATP synthase subunit 6
MLILNNTPFEQFEIYSTFSILTPWTQISFYLLLALGVYLYLFFVGIAMPYLKQVQAWEMCWFYARKHWWQHVFEFLFIFVHQLVSTYLGKKGLVYLPIIGVIFLWVLILNLLGMMPYGFTVTSHIATTGGFALALFLGINIIGIVIHKWKLFSLFLPAGVPIWLFPVLPLIELISYVFRVVSLAVRLIANMIAGHLLIHIFAGFAWTMLLSPSMLFLIAPLLFGLVVALNGLEFGICLLQAYVFITLITIYLTDVVNNSHD